MKLHEYLKALKIKASLSNNEIAQKTGISISNLSRILSGENDNPSWLTLVPLFQELHGSMDAAAGLTDDNDENLASLVGALRQRIDDQKAIIDNQQRTFDFRVNDYEKRLEDKNEVLAERQRILQKQADDAIAVYTQRLTRTTEVYEERLKEHKNQLQRERDSYADLQKRYDMLQRDMIRIRRIDSIMTVGLVILAIVAIYLTIDALNGGWGLILY